jgi:hypothetical protein
VRSKASPAASSPWHPSPTVHRPTPITTEYLGWSDDPTEVFFYNTQITVHEGSWGVYYPARFELWFSPASGGPARKLLEKIYKIEGWQR